MREMVRDDFAHLYTSASESDLNSAASLVADHLERFENEDGYSEERFLHIYALREKIDALVGRSTAASTLAAVEGPAAAVGHRLTTRVRLAVESTIAHFHLSRGREHGDALGLERGE